MKSCRRLQKICDYCTRSVSSEYYWPSTSLTFGLPDSLHSAQGDTVLGTTSHARKATLRWRLTLIPKGCLKGTFSINSRTRHPANKYGRLTPHNYKGTLCRPSQQHGLAQSWPEHQHDEGDITNQWRGIIVISLICSPHRVFRLPLEIQTNTSRLWKSL